MARAGCYVDTCVLVSLFHNDSGYPAAEAWLMQVKDRDLWISHWVLLEFASATALRQRRGDCARCQTISIGDSKTSPAPTGAR